MRRQAGRRRQPAPSSWIRRHYTRSGAHYVDGADRPPAVADEIHRYSTATDRLVSGGTVFLRYRDDIVAVSPYLAGSRIEVADYRTGYRRWKSTSGRRGRIRTARVSAAGAPAPASDRAPAPAPPAIPRRRPRKAPPWQRSSSRRHRRPLRTNRLRRDGGRLRRARPGDPRKLFQVVWTERNRGAAVLLAGQMIAVGLVIEASIRASESDSGSATGCSAPCCTGSPDVVVMTLISLLIGLLTPGRLGAAVLDDNGTSAHPAAWVQAAMYLGTAFMVGAAVS
ncbi:DUF4247 domain-containing protein [Streptomyces somaliensis]|uniref:DUF4247 domain-containing protein n=1 Tax=Streptomyces somaliensis TaxID=78355 RepID=UPI0034E98232|nr:DUF4247 domain-containing protein [Streptomyces somaliensis]